VTSWRTSFSLDDVADHELIEWLVELQAQNRASDEIRVALREHIAIQPTLADVMQELQEIKELLRNLRVATPTTQPELQTEVDDLEQRLFKTLGRFKT